MSFFLLQNLSFTSFIDACLSPALKSNIVISFKTTNESSSFLRYKTAVP